jgi:hypothetical protein
VRKTLIPTATLPERNGERPYKPIIKATTDKTQNEVLGQLQNRRKITR